MPTFYHMEQFELVVLLLEGCNLFGNVTRLIPHLSMYFKKGLDYLMNKGLNLCPHALRVGNFTLTLSIHIESVSRYTLPLMGLGTVSS